MAAGEGRKNVFAGNLNASRRGAEAEAYAVSGGAGTGGPEFQAECMLAFSFSDQKEKNWYCEQHPERLFADPLLKRTIPGPMLCCRDQRGFFLAAPFRTNCPVALPGLFCLARVEKLPSGVRMIWRFDEKGWPVNGEKTLA